MRLRDWLITNKIFFETLAAVTLTFMALVVSFSSNRIARHQVALQEAQNQPIFVLSLTDAGILQLSNLGSPARAIDLEIASYIITSAIRSGDGQRTTVRQSTADTVEYTGSPNHLTGVIYEFGEARNLALDYQYGEKFRTIGKAAAPGFTDSRIDLELIFKISYSDIYQQRRSAYLLLDFVHGNPLLDPSQGAELIRQFKAKPSRITFHRLTDDNLRDFWKDIVVNAERGPVSMPHL